MMITTAEQLQAATGCTRDRAVLFLPCLQGAMKAYDITTPRRVAGFLSQISHESGRLSRLEESLDYSVERLIALFGPHRISRGDAVLYGRAPGHRADQQAIANAVYGGEWGRQHLGNLQPGDGWRYRGRGLKQLTGRDNYNRCGKAIGEDLLECPDRLLIPVNAALSAGWFWATNNLNALADAGDVRAMTRVVNGGETGLEQRMALFESALGMFA